MGGSANFAMANSKTRLLDLYGLRHAVKTGLSWLARFGPSLWHDYRGIISRNSFCQLNVPGRNTFCPVFHCNVFVEDYNSSRVGVACPLILFGALCSEMRDFSQRKIIGPPQLPTGPASVPRKTRNSLESFHFVKFLLQN